MNARDLMNAWDEGGEHALDNTEPGGELAEKHLNEVAGMSVQSGVKGGAFPTSVNNLVKRRHNHIIFPV